ncbi:FtsX-like permease family protein [Nocardioides houyundeii]|uniref:FtsX-like permease family protein n=1 Tax=Nocardioides houyundeii TaxID=2045452 RepID=UPI000DF38521|nr:ABC transporter permease [Nocardioides houyundeii]
MWSLARSGTRAHLAAMTGTFIVLALAGALVAGTGVLFESGLRTSGDAGEGGLLVALASSFAGTTLVLVVLVVAATVSLALRQRQRDFALLRAVGATRAQVRRLVGLEVVLVGLVAVPAGAVPGLFGVRLLTPLLADAQMVPAGFTMTRSPLPVLAAVAFLLPVSLLAARLATRETLRTPPTTAVRQSVVEPDSIGPVRRTSALALAVCGLVAAFSPLVVPGTIGSAAAATSAFLLVAAAALAGPLLVAWVLGATHRVPGGPATTLALANTRGFSRRLTTAVVPLALVLAVGTVQTTVDDTVAEAATRQLADGLRADLVVTSPGLDAAGLAELAAVPGVESATALGSVTARVRVDDELGGIEALSWEAAQLRTLPAGGAGRVLDLDVVEGDLAALDRPDTVAISRDASLDTGKSVGETLLIRWPSGGEAPAEVVAVHDRGLGFGGYLTGQATPAAHGADAAPDTVLLTTSDPDAQQAVAALGLTVRDEAGYVAAASAGDDAGRALSTAMLLALLLFVGIAAANTLVLTTAGRRSELTLLRRTGATNAQLVGMAGVEALVAGVAAWVIAVAAVVPSVLGVSFGLLGPSVPPIDLVTLGGLTLVVLLVPLLTVVPVVVSANRRAGAEMIRG